MKYFFFLFCYVMMITTHCTAQNATSKEINQIKRSKEYFYSEATGESLENVKIIAKVNLVKIINDYSTKNGATSKKITVEDLQEVQYMQRILYGGTIKILAYVKRNNYVNHDTETKKTCMQQPNTTYSDSTSTIVDITSLTQNIPSPDVAALSKDTTAVSLSKWQKDAIMTISKITIAEDVVQKLIQLQNQYKIKRFGIQEGYTDKSSCFFVAYDSQKKVKALLGPGTEERYDFLTGEKRELNSYLMKGMHVIWFQLSN